MKVNGQRGIKMAVQDEFSTMEFVIRRRYKAHDHHTKNTAKDDEDKTKWGRRERKRKQHRKKV